MHISPSTQVCGTTGTFFGATEKKLTGKKYNGIRLYLGIANTMPDGMTLDKMKKDTTSDTRHIRSIFELG